MPRSENYPMTNGAVQTAVDTPVRKIALCWQVGTSETLAGCNTLFPGRGGWGGPWLLAEKYSTTG